MLLIRLYYLIKHGMTSCTGNGAGSSFLTIKEIPAGVPTLGRPTASGATPASILAAAAMPASLFRDRRSASYLMGDISSLNPFHHNAIRRQALLSMPKCATHSAGSTTGDGRILGPSKCTPRVKCARTACASAICPRSDGCIAS